MVLALALTQIWRSIFKRKKYSIIMIYLIMIEEVEYKEKYNTLDPTSATLDYENTRQVLERTGQKEFATETRGDE